MNVPLIEAPDDVKKIFEESDRFFPSPMQKLQFFEKYSRYNYEENRRETWIETVTRATNFLRELSGNKLPAEDYDRIFKGIVEMKAMPSMRLLAMAGPAARRSNVTIYNCSYQPVDALDAFVEALIISMSGCGVGFSVESKYVENLPEIKPQTGAMAPTHLVEDSADGWAAALRLGLETWFEGGDVEFDYSQIRPMGTPLRTKGGRASGPEPLQRMLDFFRNKIISKTRLTTLDAHDMMCVVGDAAVSGGVRRTAMISLFDFEDDEMRQSKDGEIPLYRWNANNSAVWPGRTLSFSEVQEQMEIIMGSGKGEPGIFSRQSAINTIPPRRQPAEFGTNPCGEIVLRPFEFCNLSIAVARHEDTFDTLKEKVELATLIGTIQSMATHFPGLRSKWKENCEEERLLGVDINGQMDSPVAQDPGVLQRLKHHAVLTNSMYANLLGINRSAGVTCNKPSGNSSTLLDCSPGIHARKYKYYLRRITVGADSPTYKVLRDAGLSMTPNRNQDDGEATAWLASFPVKAPDGAIVESERTAIAQLEHWYKNKKFWTEHNPSTTINFRPDETGEIIVWVHEHQDVLGGLTFFPTRDIGFDKSVLPYLEITKEEYEEAATNFPEIDFSNLYLYEQEDMTKAAQEFACVSGACDL